MWTPVGISLVLLDLFKVKKSKIGLGKKKVKKLVVAMVTWGDALRGQRSLGTGKISPVWVS